MIVVGLEYKGPGVQVANGKEIVKVVILKKRDSSAPGSTRSHSMLVP